MKLAILFWFYKDVGICRNRLRLLRRYNPDIPIYGLYGGSKDQLEFFQSALSPYLADFFHFSVDKDGAWKWRNGDLMITEWYRQKGRELPWDTIVVVHWDILIFGKLSEVLSELAEGQILLSNVRPVKEVSEWWPWITQHRERYESFVDHLRREYDYVDTPLCCQFVLACLPRRFLELYSSIKDPDLGFIEYRLPMYAQVFGVPFCQTRAFDCWWPDEPATKHLFKDHQPMSAAGARIPYRVIWSHLRRPDGARVFHPFLKTVPIDAASTLRFLFELVKYNELQYGRTMKWIKRWCGRSTSAPAK